MGLTDIFSDFYAAIGIAEIHAEAPPEEEEEGEGNDEGGEEKDEGDGEGEGEGGEGGEEEEGGDEEGGEEEEEEEEEEVEDPKPKLEEGRESYLCFNMVQLHKLRFSVFAIEKTRLNASMEAN